MSKKGITALVQEAYEHDDVRDQVLSDIESAGTKDKILTGELVLPDPVDARKHTDRVRNTSEAQRVEAHWKDRVSKLEAQLAALMKEMD